MSILSGRRRGMTRHRDPGPVAALPPPSMPLEPTRPPIEHVDGGEFDTSKPGVDGEPGARFDHEGFFRKQVDECGQLPEETEYNDSPEWRVWQTCAEQIPYPENMYWNKVVAASTYPDFQLAELALDTAVGGAAFLLTFPVVARRRPS